MQIDPSLHVIDTVVACPVVRKHINQAAIHKLRSEGSNNEFDESEGSNNDDSEGSNIISDGLIGLEGVVKTSNKTGSQISTYRPALNRKDVRKKVESALMFFLPRFNWATPFQMDVRQLESALNANQAKPLFYWLRTKILGLPASYYHATAGKANSWLVQKESFARTWEEVFGRKFNYAIERAEQLRPEFQEYIDGKPLPLISHGEGQRVYGPHHLIENDVKRILLNGCADFDIQAACPTIMTQHIGGTTWDVKFPLWRKYLGDRAYYRQMLAKEYKITLRQAKDVFQQLFSLGKFNGSTSGIGATVGSNKCKQMLCDPFLTGLYSEASKLWKQVGLDENGEGRFRMYEQLEQQIMQVLYDFFEENGVRYWPFHDGFTILDKHINVSVDGLHEHVKEQTGFSVIFERKIL